MFSFSIEKNISLDQARQMEHLHDIFQWPLSETVFYQFLLLSSEIDNLPLNEENDVWSYI
jgi:hypothetical protein